MKLNLAVCFLLFPERKKFYQDVSISQGEGKCEILTSMAVLGLKMLSSF